MTSQASTTSTPPPGGKGLRAERVHVRHDGADRDVLRDVTVSLEPGEILALVGPNGSGKSTLLATLAGELVPHKGTATLDGVACHRVPRRTFARRVARLPQEPQAPPGLTVRELVRLGRFAHRSPIAPLRAEDEHRVQWALRRLEIDDFASRPVMSLSGGERRRAWLAMVLAQGAQMLLLDEPTSALDLLHEWEILELLVELNREEGIAIVVSLHDLAHAARIAHRAVVLHRGRIYDVGPPEVCLDPDLLRDVFRVEAALIGDGADRRIHVKGRGLPVRSL